MSKGKSKHVPWQREEHVDEPPQLDRQDPEATKDSDPATKDDDQKRGR